MRFPAVKEMHDQSQDDQTGENWPEPVEIMEEDRTEYDEQPLDQPKPPRLGSGGKGHAKFAANDLLHPFSVPLDR